MGVLWLLRWESEVELWLILQILPVLLIPLQVIFNNFAEEILSWIGGGFLSCNNSAHLAMKHRRTAYLFSPGGQPITDSLDVPAC